MSISGILTDWFETGLEGAVWVLQEDGKDGYDGLNVLKEGDHLTILSPDGEMRWAGVIDCDREIGKRPRPTNPKFMQQVALGCWIHWAARLRTRRLGAVLHAIGRRPLPRYSCEEFCPQELDLKWWPVAEPLSRLLRFFIRHTKHGFVGDVADAGRCDTVA